MAPQATGERGKQRSVWKTHRQFRKLCTPSLCPFKVPRETVYLGATHCGWSSLFLLETMCSSTHQGDLPVHALIGHACGNVLVLPQPGRQSWVPLSHIGPAGHVKPGSLRKHAYIWLCVYTHAILKKKMMCVFPLLGSPHGESSALVHPPFPINQRAVHTAHSRNTISPQGRLLLSSPA